jgi:hypothetical protein
LPFSMLESKKKDATLRGKWALDFGHGQTENEWMSLNCLYL